MNMKRAIDSRRGLGMLAALALVGCADPCLDDGLLQTMDNSASCAAVASGTDSNGSSDGDAGTVAEADGTADSGDGCSNNIQDGDETDVDCGGSCTNNCGNGEGCGGDDDCESGNCNEEEMTCEPDDDGSCNDGQQNQDESDVDCGGTCGATCDDGEGCNGDGDCISDNCGDAGTCEPDDGNCKDGEQNQDETDVDCGASCGPTCVDGQMCQDDGDCVSDFCGSGDTCEPIPDGECDDGKQNQNETDVDCGGICGPTCEIGEMCQDGGDCVTDTCGERDTCVASSMWCDDADLDGFGDPDSCTKVPDGDDPPAGTVNNNDDCDDASEFTFPGAAPNDSLTECMEDKDGDDWGDDSPSGAATTAGTDCDDDSLTGATTFPGAAPNDSATECMKDEDDDDWGDAVPPVGVIAGADCDEADDTVPPGCMTVDCTASPINILGGATSDLLATPNLGDGNYTYDWTPPATLDDATAMDPDATPPESTTYACTATDGQGEQASDIATVHVTDVPLTLSNCGEANLGIDLSNPPPIWQYTGGGSQACEIANGDPAALVCNVVLDDAMFSSHFAVQQNADDDHIGFVWGYQDAGHFYLLTWKQTTQSFGTCPVTAPQGIVIKRIDAVGALQCQDLLDDADTANSTVLALPSDVYDQGWIDNEEYIFELEHTPLDFTARILLASDGSLIAQTTIVDSAYPTGRFGVYTYSQSSSCFWDVFTAGL